MLAFALFGCSETAQDQPDVGSSDADSSETAPDQPDTGSNDAPEFDGPTYHANIAPMMEENCVTCHAGDGIAPFDLSTYEDLVPVAHVSLQTMETGSMPPWMPDPECREYETERYLTDEEIALFRDWVDADMPEGDPSDAPSGTGESEEQPHSFDATHAGGIDGYEPSEELVDDYRCFILDIEFDETSYMTASRVVPGADNLVHHVLVYVVDEADTQRLHAADEAEDGLGYTCFGSPFPSGDGESSDQLMPPTQIGAWVPGMLPSFARDDTATRIEAGSSVVMQVHYNTLSASPENDQTSFELQITDDEPSQLTMTRPLAILDLDIPAGDSNVIFTREFTNYGSEPMTVEAVTGHMHGLGEQISLRHLRADDAESDRCVLDIPQWDFDWQQGYRFPVDDLVELATGDSLELTCVYDNSPQNQPMIDGERLSPQDVTWGDGTTDEMCLLYINQVIPAEEHILPPAEMCGHTNECLADCDDPLSMECLFGCEDSALDCLICEIDEVVECTSDDCGLQLLSASDCLTHCIGNAAMMEGSVDACMRGECTDEYEALTQCVDPVLAAGCDEALENECGLAL